ncbi:polysaccharide pyruvyl transferase family protein [Kordiimonas sp. SCSIO 12610]|uniref:polysaccharide pyruvyl transferase family protein n=1 Tax=Kordiimonas sp. SCSIO 12610 TaxID=2829597 RepID=UPI00210A85AD|nr:polysaccharide pyruvyl transferase family protein [Kordiimonas sp. SCSIO 12610]UTW55863.1 polysaccharide pyruvyl transferase family protein [Kordiimonas sp. SCSIO 12610]
MSSGLLTIGLFWHSPNSDNLGVGALTIANIELLNKAAQRAGVNLKFIIFGYLDNRDVYVKADNIETVALNGKLVALPWHGLGKHLKQCDVMFDIGGGDSFASIYGWKRITYFLISKWRTVLSGCPLILSPQTIGPFDRGFMTWFAGLTVRRAYLTFARDQLSLSHLLNDLKVPEKLSRITTDVAFALPYKKVELGKSSKPRVGINISGLLLNGGYTGQNEFGLTLDYGDLMRQAIEYFLDSGAEVHLVSHVITENVVEDDYRAAAKLIKEYPDVILVPAFKDPIEAKSYISGLDFFTGARMHACIAAASSGVPVVPMAYSRKFQGLFGAFGYNHTLECKELDTEAAIKFLKLKYENIDQLKEDVTDLYSQASEKLGVYIDEVSELMAKIS